MNSKNYLPVLLAGVLSSTLVNLNLAGEVENDSSLISQDVSLQSEHSFTFTTDNEWLLRHEDWNWFGNDHDNYEFQFLRGRIHLETQSEQFQLKLTPQYVRMNGLPDAAVLPKPFGPSGMGGLYYLHNKNENPESFGFHEAWMQFMVPAAADTRIQLGRFTYASGLEYFNGNDGKKFNALKNMRLADRLLSSFEWSAFARAFDGVNFHTSLPGKLQLSAAWMYPTQGGWEKDFNQTINDIRISTLTLTLPKDAWIKGTEIGLFTYDYQDQRDCTQRVDNSGLVCASTDIDVTTIGFHALGVRKFGKGQLDYLAWATYQWGDWYELDHQAYAFTVETGYQWPSVPMKPWLRVGGFSGSGDDNPNDNSHKTFFQMAPGTRKYQLFPYYDLQNNQSLYGHMILFPTEKLKIRLDGTINRLNESSDLWYMGTGPTQSSGSVFGYIGRPSNGATSLSKEASMMVSYQHSKRLDFQVFYAHVWGDDVIENIYSTQANADYLSFETHFKF